MRGCALACQKPISVSADEMFEFCRMAKKLHNTQNKGILYTCMEQHYFIYWCSDCALNITHNQKGYSFLWSVYEVFLSVSIDLDGMT